MSSEERATGKRTEIDGVFQCPHCRVLFSYWHRCVTRDFTTPEMRERRWMVEPPGAADTR